MPPASVLQEIALYKKKDIPGASFVPLTIPGRA
jgi:hypothetical protein